jgi:hypothetical protein
MQQQIGAHDTLGIRMIPAGVVLSGNVVHRRMPAGLVQDMARRKALPFAAILADPELRRQCVDLEREVQNLVTTAGKEYVVDAFQNSVEMEDLKYHGYGTGTTAAAVGDTQLEYEELMGQANRPTGSQTENGSTTYRTVATITKTDAGTDAVTEAGLFDQNSLGGNMLSRQVFAAINLNQNDSLETTWDITVS